MCVFGGDLSTASSPSAQPWSLLCFCFLPFPERSLVLFAPAQAADTVQAHSASLLSQQILTRQLVYVGGQMNPWGRRGDISTVPTLTRQLTPGGGKHLY